LSLGQNPNGSAGLRGRRTSIGLLVHFAEALEVVELDNVMG